MYENECMDCKDREGERYIYIGETSRSIYESRSEHEAGRKAEDGDEKSHMKKHENEVHEGKEVRWNFTLKKTCRTAMIRQISEALEIRKAEKEKRKGRSIKLLNDKQEYTRCVLPEMACTMGGKLITRKITKEIEEKRKNEERENKEVEKEIAIEQEDKEIEISKKRGREKGEVKAEKSNKKQRIEKRKV